MVPDEMFGALCHGFHKPDGLTVGREAREGASLLLSTTERLQAGFQDAAGTCEGRNVQVPRRERGAGPPLCTPASCVTQKSSCHQPAWSPGAAVYL